MVSGSILAGLGTAAVILGSIVSFLLSNERRIATLEEANRETLRRLENLESQ